MSCFLIVFVFTLPAFVNNYNFSTSATSNIGSTIGGITAPFIGLVSSLLLFYTIRLQISANEKARIKNESDIIFVLINQFDNEFDKLYYKYTKTKDGVRTEYKFTGIEAFHEFTSDFWFEESGIEYSERYQANHISLLMKSFELIDRRIEISALEPSLKEQFIGKLKSVFTSKFHEELKLILRKCKQLNETDQAVEEMNGFYNYYCKKYYDRKMEAV